MRKVSKRSTLARDAEDAESRQAAQVFAQRVAVAQARTEGWLEGARDTERMWSLIAGLAFILGVVVGARYLQGDDR